MKSKPLAGKDFLLSMTVGGRHADTHEEAGKIIDTYVLPLRKATEMAGFSWLPPLYSFGLINAPGIDPRDEIVHRAGEHGSRLRELLLSY